MRTFRSEDIRKTKLFLAWNEYLSEIFVKFEGFEFDEIFEGTADISKVADGFLDLKLEDGRQLRKISVPGAVSKNTLLKEMVYIALGKTNGVWWPLEVTSICSEVNKSKGEVHITFNPILVDQVNGHTGSKYHS